MPDKDYKSHRCGSKRCIKCWENKLNHANKRKINAKAWAQFGTQQEKQSMMKQFLRTHTEACEEIQDIDIVLHFQMYETFASWYRETYPDDGGAVPNKTQFRNMLRIHVQPSLQSTYFKDGYKLKLL